MLRQTPPPDSTTFHGQTLSALVVGPSMFSEGTQRGGTSAYQDYKNTNDGAINRVDILIVIHRSR